MALQLVEVSRPGAFAGLGEAYEPSVVGKALAWSAGTAGAVGLVYFAVNGQWGRALGASILGSSIAFFGRQL